MTRYDTITVTLEEPYNDEYVENLCHAIQLMDGVTHAEPGRVNKMALHTAKMQLQEDAFDAVREIFTE